MQTTHHSDAPNTAAAFIDFSTLHNSLWKQSPKSEALAATATKPANLTSVTTDVSGRGGPEHHYQNIIVTPSTPTTAQRLCMDGANMGVTTRYASTRNDQILCAPVSMHLFGDTLGCLHTANKRKLTESKKPLVSSITKAVRPRMMIAKMAWTILMGRMKLIMARETGRGV